MHDCLHVAVDLGAGSGRTFVGAVGPDHVVLEEVHRFSYGPRRVARHLRWDMARLFHGLGVGLRKAGEAAAARGVRLESVGVDAWGVDYALLDRAGHMIEDPICYRDERTDGVMDQVLALIPCDELFARTGVQMLQLNTIYQLFAHVRDGFPAEADRLLMIPDVCHHFLCGALSGEYTNASTTQLLDVRTGAWDDVVFSRLGLPRSLMPELVRAGTELGRLRSWHQTAFGVGPLRIVAPATHDTASAVAGTPLEPGWAFVSSGTWSLVGLELEAPLIEARAADANVSNEVGVCGTVRFLKNIMGLWLLEACRKEWAASGDGRDLNSFLAEVSAVRGFVGFVFPDATRFFNPVSMTQELRATLTRTGQAAPDNPVLLGKVMLDSLAMRYASVLETLEELSGRSVPGVHIVGGGCLNEYLNQATANAIGRPVMAGPVEATATGNLLVQAMAGGAVGSLAEARSRLRQAFKPRRFEPRDVPDWTAAARRYREIEAQALE
jgi:rhamnulokinase